MLIGIIPIVTATIDCANTVGSLPGFSIGHQAGFGSRHVAIDGWLA